jgi:HSP20 family protein
MPSPSRWPYFPDEQSLRSELARVFTPFFSAPAPRTAGVFPAVNIYDDGQSFLVRAELPGVEKGSLEVTAKGDQLTVRGERTIKTAAADASYHRRECEGGQFRRVVTLPQSVDADRIEATYKNGVLEVVLPRLPQLQPRRIPVN